METNYYENDEQRMMREEYGHEFGGCLWGFIACLIVLSAVCCLILFCR